MYGSTYGCIGFDSNLRNECDFLTPSELEDASVKIGGACGATILYDESLGCTKLSNEYVLTILIFRFTFYFNYKRPSRCCCNNRVQHKFSRTCFCCPTRIFGNKPSVTHSSIAWRRYGYNLDGR